MSWLWDASDFLTRGHCGGGWTPGLARAYQLAHFLIAVSFLLIGGSLLALHAKRKADLPAPRLLLLFSAFLALCALTHMGDVVVFYWAPYRLLSLLAIVTAIAGAAAAARVPSVVQGVIRLPSGESAHRINAVLRDELRQQAQARQELALKNARLKARVKKLENLVKTSAWINQRNEAVEELTKILAELETRPCTT